MFWKAVVSLDMILIIQDGVTTGTICNNIELKIALFHNVSSIMTSCLY